MRLDDLGPRICIFGPSNSGKSTLAEAIGRARALPVVHLDLLHHTPDTDWVPRPRDDFLALHDAAVAGERWVIEGNYSQTVPQRLAHATGVILLDVATATSLWRYIRRTMFERRQRIGALAGGRDSIKWLMIRHIAVVTPANRRRYAADFARWTLPKIRLPSPAAIDGFYRAEMLERRD